MTEKVYISGIEYSNVGAGLQLEAIYHEEGQVVGTAFQDGSLVGTGQTTTSRYEYSLKDHLGNSRIMFSDLNDDGYVQAFDL